MNQRIQIGGLLLIGLLLTACGKTEFSGGTSEASSKALEVENPPLSDLAENPDLAKNYSCGKDKVKICHVPEGNPANAHSICIGKAAVQAHLSKHQADNGDKDLLGECPGQEGGNVEKESEHGSCEESEAHSSDDESSDLD